MSIQLRIVTPTGEALSMETTQATLPGLSGEFTVMTNHLPFLTALKIGHASFATGKHTHTHYALGKGFVEIFDNQVTVFVQTAESGEEIDVKRAQEALQNAEKALSTTTPDPNDPTFQSLTEDRERAKTRLYAAGK